MTTYEVFPYQTSYGITLLSGDKMQIDSYGTAIGTTLNDGSLQTVYGTADQTTINYNGEQDVLDGGVAKNTLIASSGLQDISSAGTAISTTITGIDAEQDVETNGIASNTIVSNGGSQYIYGGEADTTVVNSGGYEELDGGVTKATTINAGGQEFVSRGTASGSTINKGGLEVVASGGTASGTTIAGGKLDLQSGAVASGSITFAGLGTLVLEGALPAIPQTFSSPLVNVAAGDVIDLKGLAYSSAVKATVVGSTLSVTSGTVSETFNLQNFMGSGFIASSDGSGGTNLTAVVLPAIAGTHASTTADEATIQPFTGVTITDANPGGIDALTIQLSGGGGTLTGQGLTYNGNGTYVLTATTPSTLTAELDALAFTPTNTTPGSQATTTFTLTDVSNAGTTVTTATTSVTDTAVPSVTFDPTTAGFANADTPVLTGTVSANAKGVELYGNGENLGAATLNGNGTWTFKGNIGAGDFADLTAVAIDAAGHSSSAAARYELVTGVTGEPYRAIEYDYTPDGSYAYTEFGRNGGDLASAADNGDGTHTMEAYAGGQVLTSIYDDVMTGDGPSERFVFSPHFGQDEITDFNVAGAGHDVVDLSNTRFSSLVEVLQHTTMSFGSATIHLNPHDSITLDGVTKAQLKAHPHDFALA